MTLRHNPRHVNLPEKREKLEFIAEHHLLSISVASNVPGFKKARCFVVSKEGEDEAQEIVKQFVQYLEDIASEANKLELKRYGDLLQTIEEKLGSTNPHPSPPTRSTHGEKEKNVSTGYDNDSESEEEEEEEATDSEFIDDDEEMDEDDLSFHRRVDQSRQDEEQHEKTDRHSTPAQSSNLQTQGNQLITKLRQQIGELTVVGFNSGKYDLNVLKDILIPYLVHTEGIQSVIKRDHAYLALKSGPLKFVDISNFLAPGTSYTQFLEAYNRKGEKGHFPYEYIRSVSQLEERQLPPREEFKSWLKNSELSEEEYAVCQRAWEEKNMKTLRDFLVWYNNLDVEPFLKALEKMEQFWCERNIDMLKDAISLPGLAFRFVMGFLRNQRLHLSSFHTEDLYNLFKDNMVGGPAIIFHRYAEANKTFVRDNREKPVQKIVGYDANALYLWALTQPMPVGLYTTWTLSEDKLKPNTVYWGEADEWLAWEAHKRNVALRTRLNDTEKRPSDEKKVRVDGYDPVNRTVYEFQGCYWHGCPTCFNPSDMNPTIGKTYEELYEKTRLRVEYLESLPNVSRVVQCWGCQWSKEKKASEINSFLNQHFPGRGEKTVTPNQLMQRVEEGTFFGAVEVDIHTPPELKEKFEEMTPIFKNTEISLDDIGEHMQTFAKKHDIMTTPRRALIGSYEGKKILLGTPLLKFYLEQGLKVTHVYRAVQW